MLERRHKPVERGGGGCHFFITLQFNHIYSVCVWAGGRGRSKVPFITFQILICTLLIHCGSVQKKLTALFNFGCNTQKNKWTILFECPGKFFLSIEKVLKKISVDQP